MNSDRFRLVEFHEAGADVVGSLDRKDKDSSVANISGSGGLDDELHDVVDLIVVCDNVDHDFGQERLLVLDATINDGVTLLAANSFNIRHRHTGGEVLKSRNYFIEFVGLDNAFDQLHISARRPIS